MLGKTYNKYYHILSGEDLMINQTKQDINTKEKISKTYVRENGTAVIVCPHCKKAKAISTHTFPQRKLMVNVLCSCSAKFKVYLDYRRTYRKPTDLVGTFKLGAGQKRLVKIKDLSMGGAQLEVVGFNKFIPGQNGSIDFILDDKKQTKITRNFSVESVTGKRIGCKFKDEIAYNKELGFYLRP